MAISEGRRVCDASWARDGAHYKRGDRCGTVARYRLRTEGLGEFWMLCCGYHAKQIAKLLASKRGVRVFLEPIGYENVVPGQGGEAHEP